MLTFKNLVRGDIVRSKLDHRTFVVTGNYGDRVIAVTSVDMTHPSEWEVVVKQDIYEDSKSGGI